MYISAFLFKHSQNENDTEKSESHEAFNNQLMINGELNNELNCFIKNIENESTKELALNNATIKYIPGQFSEFI